MPQSWLSDLVSRIAPRYQKLSLFLMESATDDIKVQQRGVALVADFRNLNISRFRSAVGLEDEQRWDWMGY